MTKLTTGELNIKLEGLDEKLSSHMEQSKTNNSALVKILDDIKTIATEGRDQAKLTNGRVNHLDEWKKDADILLEHYKDTRAQAKGAWKLWTLLAGTFTALICFAFVQYMQSIKTEIIAETSQKVVPEVSDSVYNKLEEKYYLNIK